MPESVQNSETSEEAEALSCMFSSVDSLTERIKEASDPSAADAAETRVKLGQLSSFYAPDAAAFPGYRLLQIEVLPDYILYYYMPDDETTNGFDADCGITVTYCRNTDVTLSSLSSQLGIKLTDDGFLYDAERGDLSFAVETAVLTIHAPEQCNNYDWLKASCTVEKIIIA